MCMVVINLAKNLAKNQVNQIKETAIKEIKNNSIRLAVASVKKLISNSIDKSKLDNLFEKKLEESKSNPSIKQFFQKAKSFWKN